MSKTLQVSIDGPTGAGKTTLGMGLAKHFGAAFLDTGLTYRVLGYLLARAELPGDDSWRLLVRHVPFLSDGPEKVLFKGENITEQLWGFEVDNCIDLIAHDFARREQILSYHRQIVAAYSQLMIAGRDVATTLLPQALLHVFLTAEFTVRRERRRVQHALIPERSVVVSAITERDRQTLKEFPSLPNSIILDTTHRSSDEILNQTIRHMMARDRELSHVLRRADARISDRTGFSQRAKRPGDGTAWRTARTSDSRCRCQR
jgi:cytidylate kinase